MAVRTALAATRWDVMRPALTESLLITVVGAVAGLGLATAGVRTIGALAAARMPQLIGLGLDMRVVGFALGLALVVALACGAVPAWRASTVDPQDALRAGRGAGSGKGHHRALRSLVVLEIGLSLMLLIGAGLVLKGFAGLLRNDPGFETAHILTLNVTVSQARYPNQTTIQNFLEPTVDAIRALPSAPAGVPARCRTQWGITRTSGTRPTLRRFLIVEIRRGARAFRDDQAACSWPSAAAAETSSAPTVVVVNQALSSRFSRSASGGHEISSQRHDPATIVGVERYPECRPCRGPQRDVLDVSMVRWKHRLSAWARVVTIDRRREGCSAAIRRMIQQPQSRA
jgi:hypothetical protein